MTARDPLSSLVVPIPPYRGHGAVLPQVRLASAGGPPGMSGDEFLQSLQAGSALEGQDQAARAAEAAVEQPAPNPLENMALSLAIEQQEEAVRQEAGQAHTKIDAQPPLNDADIAARQVAHGQVTGVESGAVGDIAAVGAEAQPATPDAEQALQNARTKTAKDAGAPETPPAPVPEKTSPDSNLPPGITPEQYAEEQRNAPLRSEAMNLMREYEEAAKQQDEYALAVDAALGVRGGQIGDAQRKNFEAAARAKALRDRIRAVSQEMSEPNRAWLDTKFASMMERLNPQFEEQARKGAALRERRRADVEEDYEEAMKEQADRRIESAATETPESPKSPEAPSAPEAPPAAAPEAVPAQEKRGESFQLQKAREALKAVADAEFRYNQAQINYLNASYAGQKGAALDTLKNHADVLDVGRDRARREFREYVAGLNEADREAIAAQESAVQRGVESREREAENIRIAIENKVSEEMAARPPLPPEVPRAVREQAARPTAEAAPVGAAQERQEPTPQQQIEELRNQVAELTRQLNASPRPAGTEAAPATAQELGAAVTGGAEGPPQEPEFGPEQPESSGAAEMAVEAIDGVRELGSDQELGFWERKGMQAESALFDVGAWWAGALAIRAKNSQKARERKIRSLERAAQRSAKTFVGSLLNPLKYGWRINYHRWREGIVRAASERHNDKRTRYETARNDVLSRVAAHMEVPLRTAENRAEQNRQLLEQADADVARLHGVLSAIAIRQRVAQGPELDVLLERHAAFVEQLREAETARNAAYQAYGEDNAKAGRIQRINNQILKKQNPGDRPQAGSVPREVLRPRAPVPLPRAPAK